MTFNLANPQWRGLPESWPLLGVVCAVSVVAFSLTACSGYQAYRDGQAKLADGQPEPGLSKLHEAMDADPKNADFRRSYFTQREAVVNALLREADLALDLGDFATARLDYEKVARIDTSNQRATGGLERVGAAQRHWTMLDAATATGKEGDLEGAISKVRQVLSENPNQRRAKPLLQQLLRQQADTTGKELGIYPKLKAAYRVPVTLSFTNASLLQVFEALKQASGLNYLIERDVRPDLKVTLSVTNKPVEDIIRL